MAKGISIQVLGLEKLIKKFGAIPENVKQELDAEFGEVAVRYVDRAQAAAPTDEGFLKNLITYKRNGEMDWEVVSGAPYAAYVEFGTRSKVKIPAGLEAYAAQFKGKGKGDYYDFLNAILDWVKRKGLHEVTDSYTGKKVGGKAAQENLLVLAEAIAWAILRKGIEAHPYFFPQLPIAKAEIRKAKNAVVKRALSK